MDIFDVSNCIAKSDQNCSSDCNTVNNIRSGLEDVNKLSNRLDDIIDTFFDGFVITDGQANVLKINKAYEEITGIKKKEMVGENMALLVKKGYFSQSSAMIVINTNKEVTINQTIKSGQKMGKKILVSSKPMFNNDGQIEYIVSNVRDVTELVFLKEKYTEKIEENEKYRAEIEIIKSQLNKNNEIVANDIKMLNVLNLAKRVSKVDSTVLILGETGVGKEEMARFIHNNSDRKSENFIKIDCGTIPENLIESELFGYEKGAFTGANSVGKMGYFEVANNGTIFLDEVGELPLNTQVKLLRVLQDGQIERVGSYKPIKIDVRIISATNRNLEEMVRKQTFRQDLYYRLNVVPIIIPPLRERKGDITPLVRHFADIYNKKYHLARSFSDEALKAVLEYEWPGNIRELKNLVERVVIMSDSNQISVSDLPIYSERTREINEFSSMINLNEVMEKIEYDYINKAYEKFKNVRDAAKYLDMTMPTYVRKRKSFKEKYG